MSNYFIIYLFSRLDAIITVSTVLCVLSVFVLIGYLVIRGIDSYDQSDRDEYDKQYGFVIKYAKVIFITTLLISLITPSKNDAIMVYAGGKTIDFAEKDSSLSKIPSQTTKIISDYLQKQIESTKKETP